MNTNDRGNNKGSKDSILLRVRVSFVAALVLATAIVYKIVDIQYVNGEKWMKKAQESSLRFMEVTPTRGNILSDDGTLLATSIPFFKVAIDPVISSEEVFTAGIDSLSSLLASFFQEGTAEEYKENLLADRLVGKRYRLLSKKQITYQDKKEIEKWPIFKEGRMKGGVVFEKHETRFRPFASLGKRVIGFVKEDSTDDIRGRGLEYSFNDVLGGVSGRALYQKISGGIWKPVTNDESYVRPENGSDIQTTINLELQEYCSDVLKESLQRYAANYGCVILMEVETGEIKALVNLGRVSAGEYAEDNNYAVGSVGLTEPGSTFKLMSMMALLENSKVSILDTVNTGTGEYMFYEDAIMTDAKLGGHGNITVQEVFEKSSNIGVAKLIFKNFHGDPKKFTDYLQGLGLNKPLDFQMVGAGTPYVKTPDDESWSGSSLPWMSIGYEMKLSPLQVLAFYNAVANKGRMIQPLIVKRVYKATSIVEEFEAKVLDDKICSNKTLETLRNMLEGVVERGTATVIRTDNYRIAGKTGTTQKLKNGQYTKSYYTSFVGYFPADKPKYSAIVVIDDPKGEDRFASDVAAPVFRKIADKAFVFGTQRSFSDSDTAIVFSAPQAKGGHYADLAYICGEMGITNVSYNTEAWVSGKTSTDTIRWINVLQPEKKIPDVTGMSLREAMYMLESRGAKVVARGEGRVISQNISPGTTIYRGTTIYLTLKN